MYIFGPDSEKWKVIESNLKKINVSNGEFVRIKEYVCGCYYIHKFLDDHKNCLLNKKFFNWIKVVYFDNKWVKDCNTPEAAKDEYNYEKGQIEKDLIESFDLTNNLYKAETLEEIKESFSQIIEKMKQFEDTWNTILHQLKELALQEAMKQKGKFLGLE